MKTKFENIKDFLSIKERCPFCNGKLKSIFINFSRQPNNIPRIKSEIDGDELSFVFTDVTAHHKIHVSIQIDMATNMMKISPLSDDNVFDTNYFWLIESTFENLGPHMELYCPKKKCMKYCLVSNTFKADCKEKPPGLLYKIKPVYLFYESFSTPNLWIQNEWSHARTNIYSKSNLDIEPLRTKLLDIEALGAEKVLTRVKTLVTFS